MDKLLINFLIIVETEHKHNSNVPLTVETYITPTAVNSV